MTLLFFALVIALGWWVLKLYNKLYDLDHEFRAQLSQALDKLAALEKREHPRPAPPPPRPAIVPDPAPPAIVRERPAPIPPVPVPVYVPPPYIPEPRFAEPAGPTLRDRLRRMAGDQEWELLVGGSLLNKLGAVILVIGIALFLGYSFGHVSPAERAAAAIALSLSLLGAGVRLEQQGRYRIFARGLIGAGWAALYATAYAIYAIPQARLISNPFAGSILLVFVAIAMIAHSLRYKAQSLTGVAYFAAFAAMAATPSTPFAVLGLIPLAASLLYLAWRFDWHAMSLFGLAATYLTCISRGSSNAPLGSTQSLFLTYWILFEGFDLLRIRRRATAPALDLLFPINTICFLGLSYVAWSKHSPQDLWIAAAFAAALFLASALARAVLRPPGTFEDADDPLTRLRAGSYEGSFVLSALLAGLAVVGRVPGMWAAASLAVESEIIYLAGLRLRSTFLRRFGASAFTASIFQTLYSPQAQSKTLLFGTYAAWNWTPPLLFHATLFYGNRVLRQPNAIMSSVAALITACVLVAEVPAAWLGTALLVFGVALLETGRRRNAIEFRAQSWCVLAAGVFATAAAVIERTEWIPQAIGLAIIYACALRTKGLRTQAAEDSPFAIAGASCTALISAMLIWRLTPEAYLALGWWLLALFVLELGSKRLPTELRLCFGPVALFAALDCASQTIVKFPPTPVVLSWAAMCLVAVAATVRYTLAPPPESATWERTRLRDAMASLAVAAAFVLVWMAVPDPYVSVIWTAIAVAALEARFRYIALAAFLALYLRVFAYELDLPGFRPTALISAVIACAGFYWSWYRTRAENDTLNRLQFWLALLPGLLLIETQAGAHNAPAGWALAALILLAFKSIPDARMQSYGVAALAFLWALSIDIDPPRLWITVPGAATYYAAQYLSRGMEKQEIYFSMLGTVLVSALLYGQASGGLLTVAWGVQSVALLACGFLLHQRVLRLQGLALLLICILKLFLYDLRNLETVYRILSFVILGVILLGVSWIYSRFRENLRALL